MRGTVAKRLRRFFSEVCDVKASGPVITNRCRKLVVVGVDAHGLPIRAPSSEHGTLVHTRYSERGLYQSYKRTGIPDSPRRPLGAGR